MSLTKSTIEHEFLFRWDEQGNPKGCHIAYREAIKENGVEINSKFLDPRPVNLSDAEKLAEIGASINASVLADNTDKAAQLVTAAATLEQEKQARAQEVAQLAASHASALGSLVDNHEQAINELKIERTEALDAMQEIVAETQAARDAALVQVSGLQGQVETLTTQVSVQTSQNTLLAEQIEILKGQLVEYQTPVDENGVPKEVTMRQAQLALLGVNLLATVEAAINAIPGVAGQAARITWAKSSSVKRDSPLIAQLAGVLGLTDKMIDELFIGAATL